MESTWNFHRFDALMRHWSREGPPPYIAAGAWLGLRKPRPSAAETLQGQDLLNFLGAFPGGEAAASASAFEEVADVR